MLTLFSTILQGLATLESWICLCSIKVCVLALIHVQRRKNKKRKSRERQEFIAVGGKGL